MNWKPLHEAHAIERVRVMFNFAEPLTSKLLSSSTKETIDRADEFGFDAVEPAESSFKTIRLGKDGVPTVGDAKQNGTVIKRFSEGQLLEEAGFRDSAFGYVTLTYGRWENLRNRIEELFYNALNSVDDAADVESCKLEYWDSFQFEGPLDEADVSELVTHYDSAIPESVREGASQWHSHAGWFEPGGFGPVLVNRNIDVVDKVRDDGEKFRALGIHTLVEQRSETKSLPIANFLDYLEMMHRRSLYLFGDTITEPYRKMIGLNLEEYK